MQPDPAGPFATVLRVAQDLCSPLTGAIIDRLKLERDRAEAAPAVSATVPAPPVQAGSSAQHPYDRQVIALRVEDSDELAETGMELSFSAHEIGNDMGELVRRICDKLNLGKGLGALTKRCFGFCAALTFSSHAVLALPWSLLAASSDLCGAL